MSIGRGGVLTKDTAQFYFIAADISLNNQSIRFKDLEETLAINNISELNNCLESEPFAVNNNSEFTITYATGFIDSLSAVSSLSDDNSISFRLELVDNNTGELLGNLKEITFNSENIDNISESFLVNTPGIGNRTVKVKINVNINGEWNYYLVDNYSDVDAVGKENYTNINLNGEGLVKDYALSQNYPNPFNPSTTINFQIPNDGFVTLKIYDVLGNEIKTLVDEQKSTGRYQASFDASDLSSGVYIYKIQVNDFISSKKMMLLK